MRLFEDAVRATPKVIGVSLVRDRKPADGNAVDRLDAHGTLVSPRDVIARAGRDDFDGGMARQTFRDVACVQFGAAVDVGAVPLDHDREVHESERSGADGGLSLAGACGAASRAP